jgi:hypothetical protein
MHLGHGSFDIRQHFLNDDMLRSASNALEVIGHLELRKEEPPVLFLELARFAGGVFLR